jgi:ankyrin repeat protein
MGSRVATQDIGSKSPLLKLPNELLLEVALHLERFQDLNSLLRTSKLFHTVFHTLLYRRAITAKDIVRDQIVWRVLSRCRVASLRHLLDNGLSANNQFSDGRNLLRTLCQLDDKERSVPLVRLLLKRGADIESKDTRTGSSTVLHVAARNDNCEIATLLLAHGADVNATEVHKRTPLHDAAFQGHCDSAALLLAHGADVNAVSTHGNTPLLEAAVACRSDIASVLLAHGADVNAVSTHGNTPLLEAVVACRSDIASVLLAHGAAVDARSATGDTPLLVALHNRNKDVIPVLLAHGADVDARDVLGRTPLHVASTYFAQADHTLAKLLVEHDADVNAIDSAGRTPLHLATREFVDCYDDELFMPKFLLENGAAVDAISNKGRSPLQEVISDPWDAEEYADLVALFIAHGADVPALNSADGE